MSVIIKGMDMPKDCAGCDLSIYYDGYNGGYGYNPSGWRCRRLNRLIENGENDRPIDCPVREIPAPHGRLIDADKLSISVLEAMNNGDDSVIGLIDKTPTIIEVEQSDG